MEERIEIKKNILTDENVQSPVDNVITSTFEMLTPDAENEILKSCNNATGRDKTGSEQENSDSIVPTYYDESNLENTTIVATTPSPTKVCTNKTFHQNNQLENRYHSTSSSGSMASEDGTNWRHNFQQELSENNEVAGAESSTLPSSLTYNYIETIPENEDLELSKDASISNPFMITKIRNVNRKLSEKSSNVQHNSSEIPNVGKIREERQLSKAAEEELIKLQHTYSKKNNVVDTAVSNHMKQKNIDTYAKSVSCMHNKKPKLMHFSEYTNNYVFTQKNDFFPKHGTDSFTKEILWLQSRNDPTIPSPSLLKGLRAHVKKQGRIEATANEWYLFTPDSL